MAEITVQTPTRFNFRSTLMSHGWVQLAPFQHDAEFTKLRRVHRLGDGTTVQLEFSAAEDQSLLVSFEHGHATEIAETAIRIFNLNVDLAPFYEALRDCERYGWVRLHGGGRLLRSPTVWEDLAKTLLTTNTSWVMTKRMVQRLTEIGEPHVDGGCAFPTADAVAALQFDGFAAQVGAGYRNAYLYELATNIAEGIINVEAWVESEMPTEELYDIVRSLKGFGPYAAGAVLKLLGRFDYLALDSAARSAFKESFGDGEAVLDKHIHAHYASYGEWQGLVIWMDVMREWFLQNYPRQTPPNPASS